MALKLGALQNPYFMACHFFWDIGYKQAYLIVLCSKWVFDSFFFFSTLLSFQHLFFQLWYNTLQFLECLNKHNCLHVRFLFCIYRKISTTDHQPVAGVETTADQGHIDQEFMYRRSHCLRLVSTSLTFCANRAKKQKQKRFISHPSHGMWTHFVALLSMPRSNIWLFLVVRKKWQTNVDQKHNEKRIPPILHYSFENKT